MIRGLIEFTKSEGFWTVDFMICLWFELLSILEKSKIYKCIFHKYFCYQNC